MYNHSNINAAYNQSNKSSVKTAAERNEEYLQRLEHKNRLKKNLSLKKSSEKLFEDREKGKLCRQKTNFEFLNENDFFF